MFLFVGGCECGGKGSLANLKFRALRTIPHVGSAIE